jgi:NAD(P)-dependent dehydrogenase (short-subunit alcohol dehydrogenase family)
MRLKDKVALVTGGGAGIGRATAALFAREGASVLIAEFDAETGDAARREITDAGGRAVFLRTDVSKPEQVEAAIKRCVVEFGGLDVLYNNVGGSTLQDGPVTTAPLEEFRNKIDVDLFGTFLGCRFAVPEMEKRGGGSIINATSIVGLRGTYGRDCYTAAKGAISALTRSMAVEFAPLKIRVNAIAPGATDTERTLKRRASGAQLSGPMKERQAAIVARHHLGRLEPIDIAYAVLYFASDESRKTTGQILAVDSGFTAS